MKIMKFGGTSVGSPARMHALVELVNQKRPVLVVLSAVSGTTNSLVEIANSLYIGHKSLAKEQILALEKKYTVFVNELFSSEEYKKKGHELIATHFEYIQSFTNDLFTVYEERAILAQGELISTALFHYYLQEIKVPSVLLAALNFMRIDENDEPDLAYIEEHLKKELAPIIFLLPKDIFVAMHLVRLII